MNTTQRSYRSRDPFIVDDRTLLRLRGVLEEFLPGEDGIVCAVTTRGHERTKGTAEEVLAHPNLDVDPIVFLEMRTESDSRSIRLTANSSTGTDRLKLEISTRDDAEAWRWLNRLEKELEATRLSGFWYPIKRVLAELVFLFVISGMVILFAGFALISGDRVGAERMWLSSEDMRELQRMERVTAREVLERQLKNRWARETRRTAVPIPTTFKSLVMVVPAMIVLWGTAHILRKLTPWGVFEWGDQKRRYKEITEKRDLIQNWVYGGLVVEILGAVWAFSAFG